MIFKWEPEETGFWLVLGFLHVSLTRYDRNWSVSISWIEGGLKG